MLVAAGVLAAFSLLYLIPSIGLRMAGLDRPTIPLVGKGLQIYDRFDRQVCTIYGERDQQLVKLENIAPSVKEAFVAAEDHDYYRHGGIDVFGVARAITVNVSQGEAVQGGSTITQQLIKNLYFEDNGSLYGSRY
jgi:membrane peptidoglycan carboxypeptidase